MRKKEVMVHETNKKFKYFPLFSCLLVFLIESGNVNFSLLSRVRFDNQSTKVSNSNPSSIFVDAIDHFKELNTINDLFMLGYLQKFDDFYQKLPYQFSNNQIPSVFNPLKDGFVELKDENVEKENEKFTFRKNTLFAFGMSDPQCIQEIRRLDFPKFLGHLGNNFESGEIMMDRFNDIGKLFGVKDGCSKEFIFIRKGTTVSFLEMYKKSEDSTKNNIFTPQNIKLLYPNDIYSLEDPANSKVLKDWLSGLLKMNTEIVNDLEFPIEIKWEEFDNLIQKEILITSLEPMESFELDTYESHIFTFYHSYNKRQALLRARMTKENFHMKTVFLSEMLELANEKEYGFSGLVTTDIVWGKRKNNNIRRIMRNEDQPASKKRYTSKGYKHMRLPSNVYNLILEYYEENKRLQNGVEETWNSDDCHTNFFAAPSTMYHLPGDMKTVIFDTLAPIMQEWSGIPKLKGTSCYGVREYHTDAWLREHVDTGDTHIISGIMQIKKNVTTDWPLTFIDHDGERHYITLEEGDLLLYESASCLHGRPIPFNGEYFANTFIHYMPV